jgi:ABC-type branched-subunit amino acid transport system permease subunit
MSFLALRAAVFSHLAIQAHLPWLVAVLLTAVIAAPIGAMLAIPATRFPEFYLALDT